MDTRRKFLRLHLRHPVEFDLQELSRPSALQSFVTTTMNDTALAIVSVGLIGVTLLMYRQLNAKQQLGPLPPGPRRLPLIGNVTELPQSQPWVKFATLGRIYG